VKRPQPPGQESVNESEVSNHDEDHQDSDVYTAEPERKECTEGIVSQLTDGWDGWDGGDVLQRRTFPPSSEEGGKGLDDETSPPSQPSQPYTGVHKPTPVIVQKFPPKGAAKPPEDPDGPWEEFVV
jgi:hypothetical protein